MALQAREGDDLRHCAAQINNTTQSIVYTYIAIHRVRIFFACLPLFLEIVSLSSSSTNKKPPNLSSVPCGLYLGGRYPCLPFRKTPLTLKGGGRDTHPFTGGHGQRVRRLPLLGRRHRCLHRVGRTQLVGTAVVRHPGK